MLCKWLAFYAMKTTAAQKTTKTTVEKLLK